MQEGASPELIDAHGLDGPHADEQSSLQAAGRQSPDSVGLSRSLSRVSGISVDMQPDEFGPGRYASLFIYTSFRQ
jgi:hypothetical protein